MRVQSLGGEDPLEEDVADHSSFLACRILWTLHGLSSTRGAWQATVHRVTKSGTQLKQLSS